MSEEMETTTIIQVTKKGKIYDVIVDKDKETELRKHK